MVQIQELTVTLGNKKILDRISTAFPAGKTSLILGRNGSGKSTLLKTLAGLLKITAGEVLLHGKNLTGFSRKELARRCAVLLQEPAAPPDMQVATLVMLGRFPHDTGRETDRNAVKRALDDLGIAHLSERKLGTLSGGERRKAFFARALAQETGLLILDEPDAALDAAAKNELLKTLRELKTRRQLTVIMAAHDWDFALNAADFVCGLKHGTLCCSGTPEQIVQPEILQELFGISGIILRDKYGKLRILPEYRQ